MYVAIVSGEVPYDGRLEPITAGVTYIAAGHEIVRRFPHMFKRASSTRPARPRAGSAKVERARSASLTPKASEARKETELRTSAVSPIPVALSGVARGTIINEVTNWTSMREGESHESGGYLFGRRTTEGLELELAAYAGEETKRSFGKVHLDVDKGLAVERSLQRWHSRKRLIGDYHSHTHGDGVPSPGDLRAWMRSIEMLMSDDPPPTWLLGEEITRDCWAGIIVTSSAGGNWMYPQLHAWITRWDYAGFICEPATLVER